MLDMLTNCYQYGVCSSDSFDAARLMPSSQEVIRLRGYDDTGSSMTICFRIFRRYISKATLTFRTQTQEKRDA